MPIAAGAPQSRRRHLLSIATAVLVATVVGGCGADAAESEARDAADAFVADVASDPAAACQRLAPDTHASLEEDSGTSCETALGELGLESAGPAEEVDVAGHAAQVRYAGDTLFLGLFDDGWRVTAAGCERPSGDRAEPYDCDVEGG